MNRQSTQIDFLDFLRMVERTKNPKCLDNRQTSGHIGVRCNVDYGCSGAFFDWTDDSTRTGEISISGTEKNVRRLPFNALNSNSTYSGNSVQPKALQTLACIRY